MIKNSLTDTVRLFFVWIEKGSLHEGAVEPQCGETEGVSAY